MGDRMNHWHAAHRLGGFVRKQVAVSVQRERDGRVPHKGLYRLRACSADRRTRAGGVPERVKVGPPSVVVLCPQEVRAFSFHPLGTVLGDAPQPSPLIDQQYPPRALPGRRRVLHTGEGIGREPSIGHALSRERLKGRDVPVRRARRPRAISFYPFRPLCMGFDRRSLRKSVRRLQFLPGVIDESGQS